MPSIFICQKFGWQSIESPVVTISRPHGNMRGPGISPLSIARLSVTSILCTAPAPTAPVNPDRSSNSAFFAAISVRYVAGYFMSISSRSDMFA